MLRILDTLSGKKAPLPEPREQKKLRLFVCGPTVYDYAHIGHARTYIFFDFFAKYLRARGYDVFYLQNITDIDDKIIRRAAEENKKPEEVAKFFAEAYLADMASLGIASVSQYAPATQFISQIAAQVERLIDKGYAYKIDGDGWYFDIAKFPDYGKLSRRTSLQAEDAVSRIDESVGKRNKGDFCLWKFSKPGEPSWPAPAIGGGRPGWHIEDTAISEFYFGPQYELHGGGIDLKFPHHEAEIAQQESASGRKPFVKIWMHTGALLVEGKKMSKSLGNFITVRDFLKKYDANVLRWIALTHHYRSPIDYSEAIAGAAERRLYEVGAIVRKLEIISGQSPSSPTSLREIPPELIPALDDDINTPNAIATIFEYLNTLLVTKLAGIPPDVADDGARRIRSFFAFIGIALPNPKIPEKASKLAALREECRGSQQFDKADALRREINGLGYDIEDTPKGPFLWPRTKKRN